MINLCLKVFSTNVAFLEAPSDKPAQLECQHNNEDKLGSSFVERESGKELGLHDPPI